MARRTCSRWSIRALDFWLTTGRFNAAFEERLAARLGVRHALTTNSGSSANLLALSSLTSHYLRGDALKPGDEVITVATGFPTTVNPSLQYGLVPVFVDVDIPTYNIKPEHDRGGGIEQDPRDHDRPHARQSVRPGRGDAGRREAQPVGGRGLLRRAGRDL